MFDRVSNTPLLMGRSPRFTSFKKTCAVASYVPVLPAEKYETSYLSLKILNLGNLRKQKYKLKIHCHVPCTRASAVILVFFCFIFSPIIRQFVRVGTLLQRTWSELLTHYSPVLLFSSPLKTSENL